MCLHNQSAPRTASSPSHENAKLAVATTEHSNDMVASRYFDHNTPAGGAFVERVLNAGYAGADNGLDAR